jgi:O-succinylbenzoic acid--CoA ligase
VEVENLLVGHPAVQEAATVGVPCPVLGETHPRLVYAPGASDRGSLRAEMVARCRTELADNKTPDGGAGWRSPCRGMPTERC